MTGDSSAVPDTYAAYAEGREDPRFTEWLRAQAGPSWDAATDHRFTRELHADTLDDAVFRRYLVQDYAFLETLVGTFGHSVGDAPSMAAKSRLVDFLGTLTDDENDYFERSFDALGVPESTYEDPALTETTAAFRDLLLRASREGGYAETLAVLVPAEWVYLAWATAEGDADRPERFYLAEWVDLHAVPAFESFVEWLRTELDRAGAAASERRQARLADLFCRTVDLEVAFFDAAYEGDDAGTATDGGDRSW
ncbi:TenA family protein [Haloarcula pellucida]|uniref:Aminopyrimidine aminohydrolase n=1 Tax=Haloarcula pellucida TaxID=1427151 RepID=A0A830GP81_9EURY|nr:TenA family protein [Halomicroarcula pellucida]GGN99231.1 aminopyrimidine aminohydrolase [Halomicroarcula pellucida]